MQDKLSAFEESSWMSDHYEFGLVSVIIPTFNRAHLITNALNSVRCQPYRPIELIVVDDGSNDDTEAVVESWGSGWEDPELEVRYIKKENAGAPSARNLGLVQSVGEFIQYLDSDDQLAPRALSESMLRVFRDGSVDLLVGLIRSTRIGLVNNKGNTGIGFGRLFRHISPNCSVFRRRLAICVGPWDTGLVKHQDRHYMLLVMTYLPRAYYVNTLRYIYNIHDDARIGNRDMNSVAECVQYLRLIKAFERSVKGPYDCHQHELAAIYRRTAHRLADLHHYKLADFLLRRSVLRCGAANLECAKNVLLVLAYKVLNGEGAYGILNRWVRK